MRKLKEYLNEQSSRSVLWDLIDQRELRDLMKNMDDQSKKLIRDITDKLGDALTLKGRQTPAYNRLRNLIGQKSTDEANLRNQVFKIAHDLGIKLPSSSF
jgi:hypothetical protein